MIDFEALEAILERVKKPARYLGGEWNSVVKDENVVELKVLLSYPDAYELGVSNQGVQILYTVLNGRPEYLCERAYAPWPDMEAELRAAGMPLFGLDMVRAHCAEHSALTDRLTLLHRIAEIPGWHVPSAYDVAHAPDGGVGSVVGPSLPIQKRYVAELRPEWYPESPIVPSMRPVHARA
jgi:hypothetical protein